MSLKEFVCPQCGQKFKGFPARSRKDNVTEICSDCGTREALIAVGLDSEEIEEIIAEIHRHTLQESNKKHT